VIEPPDLTYPRLKAGPIRIDAGEGQPRQGATALPIAPAGTSTTWMYLGDLNASALARFDPGSLARSGPPLSSRR
jgi:hypothetical protein